MSFEEISHTADVKIRVHTLTLDALFSETCDALMQVMYGKSREGSIQKVVDLDAENLEDLLLDFLSEVLFVSEVEGIVFSNVKVKINELHLHAVLLGEKFSQKKHSGGTEVKGISYSGLSISHNANGYIVDILFDV
jgi:SHS2 domain-containing protein